MNLRTRILHCALGLYPGWWRKRYGPDVRTLVQELASEPRSTAGIFVDLVRGAFDARLAGHGKPSLTNVGPGGEAWRSRHRGRALVVGSCLAVAACAAVAIGWGTASRPMPTHAATSPALAAETADLQPGETAQVRWLCTRAATAQAAGQLNGFLRYVATQCTRWGLAALTRSLVASAPAGDSQALAGDMMCRYAALQVARGDPTAIDRGMADSCQAPPPPVPKGVPVVAGRLTVPAGLREVNAWYGTVDGAEVAVFAGTATVGSGTSAADPAGAVALERGNGTRGAVRTIPGSGAATITGAAGDVLTIRTADGRTYRFDVATDAWGAS